LNPICSIRFNNQRFWKTLDVYIAEDEKYEKSCYRPDLKSKALERRL
jgi:hypothetical protein